MTSEAISLFYEEPQPTTAAERAALDAWTGAEPGEGITPADLRTTEAPMVAVGDLVRWYDGGCPHVGRVEAVHDDQAVVAYGPKPHRADVPLAALEVRPRKNGRGVVR